MDKAIIGLIGVVIGAFATLFKDWALQRMKRKKEYEYLVIRVVCNLERFVNGCVDVVNDDGTIYGQYGEDGRAHAQVKPPNFSPYDLDVEWKSLPPKLMYDVLSLPNKIAFANEVITATFDHVASPPEYEEGFEVRQEQYSDLGIFALELAVRLRKFAGLPPLEFPENWNPNKILQDKKIEIIKRKEGRAKAHEESMKRLELG